ncbi:MAG: EamA family transporter [Pseudomonadota bacterium]
MELWMVVTVAAAFLQNVRSTLQKHLKSAMGTTGATFVRFGFGLPVALLYGLVLFAGLKLPLPGLTAGFALWTGVGALAQIGATFLLIHLFSFRNFTVGSAYSRTEPVQTAVFAAVLFGEDFAPGAIFAILIAVVGLMVISVARTKVTPLTLLTSVLAPTALIGLAAGTLFGLAAIGFQEAARSVVSEHFVVQAAATLIAGLALQTLVMMLYMGLRDRAEIRRILGAWKVSAAVGFVGATATFGWFIAFTLQQAALVKVLAQVEMLFTIGSSVLVFKERINRLELAGCALIVLGILVLLGSG